MKGNDVLILAGSLRRGSVSRVVGEVLYRSLIGSGVPTRLLFIEQLSLPFFNPDVHYADPSVAQDYLDEVRACRAMIWCSPSYHRTISGSFKNAIDFLELLADDTPAYLTGKIVGAVATSQGVVSAANATAELAMAAQALRAFALPLLIPITGSHKLLDAAGNIGDERICRKLDLLAKDVRNFLASNPAPSTEIKEAG